MTPKEKAIELFNNFSRTHVLGILNTKGKLVTPYSSGYASVEVRNVRAKNSALIAVDEMLKFEKSTVKQIENHLDLFKDMQFKTESFYWQEVKQEIEKL